MKSTQLLAINDGGMEIADEASKYSSTWLLAISETSGHLSAQLLASIGEGRNEYWWQRIRILICLPVGYWNDHQWNIQAQLSAQLLLFCEEGTNIADKASGNLSAWLRAVGIGMKIANETSGHSSTWLLAIDIGMKITNKSSKHLST
jgi:hypothetical protein